MTILKQNVHQFLHRIVVIRSHAGNGYSLHFPVHQDNRIFFHRKLQHCRIIGFILHAHQNDAADPEAPEILNSFRLLLHASVGTPQHHIVALLPAFPLDTANQLASKGNTKGIDDHSDYFFSF